MRTGFFFAAVVIAVCHGQSWGNELAQQAYDILDKRCYSCHGQKFTVADFNIRDHARVIQDMGDDSYVVPGNLEKSQIYVRVAIDRDMPEKKALPEGLPEEEIEVIRRWIENGAPAWESSYPREPITSADVLADVYRYLDDPSREAAIKTTRIFSVVHLHNNPSISPAEMQQYRAALSKAVNFMSRGSRIVLPEAINESETLYAVDLRDVGWDGRDTWRAVLTEYPYGTAPMNPDERLVFDKIANLYGSFNFDGFVTIRADWFAAVATRPPIYHALLDIPEKLSELYKRQGIDPIANFRNGTAKRAGMSKSGVSAQNRMVEVHDQGAFWISYDFKGHAGRSSLARFPLGPVFEGNEFEQFAFQHDGGEAIFELRNGLHGYMLITSSGDRIDSGPVEIVFDKKMISGTPIIVNGLSCISCHREGLQALTDDIREGHARRFSAADKKVKELYLTKSAMDALIEETNDRYARALKQAIGPFFDQDRDVRRFEPISFAAAAYDRDVDIVTALRELGILDRDDAIAAQIKTSGRIVSFGVGPLGEPGGVIKRKFWESSIDAGVSVYQRMALELGVGTSVVP
ncbi:MAG: c-type cytochrome domain-containing protein [Planctomycetaceae bacterium]